ncbi:MAG TPA: hypothetical protein VFP87_15825 [Chitinophagaceae bacterium]|nr:hypothetical protein [Chitinophagaceae bacterium]
MKIRLTALLLMLVIASCRNTTKTGTASDSTTINTNTGNMPEGGPNHGLPDTNTYNRSNDTLTHDTASKK